MAHDIGKLESKIGVLREAISKLHDAKHAELLVPVIHRPGLTTVAEFEFVQAHVDSLHSQVSSAHRSFDALVKTA